MSALAEGWCPFRDFVNGHPPVIDCEPGKFVDDPELTKHRVWHYMRPRSADTWQSLCEKYYALGGTVRLVAYPGNLKCGSCEQRLRYMGLDE